MQRQVWITPKAGAIHNLALQTQDMPPRKAGFLRIKVKAVGLNFADIFALTGLYSATPEGAFIPGLEFSGQVLQCDEGSAYNVGDNIMGVTRFGGYTSVIDIEEHYIQPLPGAWSFSQGAAYLVQTLTAFYGLTELGNIKPKQTVLVHSAGGGVGLQAMKLIKSMGATAIGSVSSVHKQQVLSDMGFERILVREKDFKRQLKQASLNFDLVLDGIGGAVQQASFEHLNPMGRLVVFGAAEFTPGKNRPNYVSAIFKYLFRPKYDVLDMISENKSLLAFNLIWLWQQTEFMSQLIQGMGQHEIDAPYVAHEYDFKDAFDAIECLRSGKSMGKVVLTLE